MDSPPLISVIIPCHNQGHFLREALESVRTATTHDTEIIVVDDGSTDATASVAAAWPCTTCVRQANAGAAAARNRGLEEARGRYVAFLDADDRMAPSGLDIGLRALNARPECALVYGRCVMMSADGTLQPTPPQPRIERDHYRELLRQNVIWMPAMALFQREAVARAGGFDPAVDAAADYRLYLRITRVASIYDHGEVVAYYRQHDANMSRNSARMLRESLAALAGEWPIVRGDSQLEAAYREGWRMWQGFYGTHLVNEIRRHVHRHEWADAAHKTLTLGRLHPRGLLEHATRKALLTLRGVPTADAPQRGD